MEQVSLARAGRQFLCPLRRLSNQLFVLALFDSYSAAASEHSEQSSLTGTVRLRWNYRPDSDLYIIYTAGQRFASLETNAPQYYQNSLTAKLTYSWRP